MAVKVTIGFERSSLFKSFFLMKWDLLSSCVLWCVKERFLLIEVWSWGDSSVHSVRVWVWILLTDFVKAWQGGSYPATESMVFPGQQGWPNMWSVGLVRDTVWETKSRIIEKDIQHPSLASPHSPTPLQMHVPSTRAHTHTEEGVSFYPSPFSLTCSKCWELNPCTW